MTRKISRSETRDALRAHEAAYNAAMRAMKDTGHRPMALELAAGANYDAAFTTSACEEARERAESELTLTSFKLLADAHAEIIRNLRKHL